MKADRFDWLADASPELREELIQWLSASEREEFIYDWNFWARDSQLAPVGNWQVWLILAGRGFGKTRSGAEWARRVAEDTSSIDIDANRVQVSGITPSLFLDGQLRFRTGPQTGLVFCIIAADASGLLLDRPLATGIAQQLPVELREGCDHRFETCSNRFSNSVNFRGEPFLPGNDLLARYPKPQ